jgi:hypothetical protein
MGMTGRGAVLRSVSETIGLTGGKVVPSEAELQKKEQQQERSATDSLGLGGEQ